MNKKHFIAELRSKCEKAKKGMPQDFSEIEEDFIVGIQGPGMIAEPSREEIRAALDESDIYITILMSVLENKNACTRHVIDRACSQWLEVNEKLVSLVEQLKNAQDIETLENTV